MDQPPPPPSSTFFPWYVKLFLVVAVLGFIYMQLRPYIYHVIDMIETLRKLINILIEFSSNVAETAVDQTATGSKLVVNKVAKPGPIPDVSRNKSGFCYVGEYKGIRSCVKVDKSDSCSTQVYSTQSQCVNPELR